MTRPTLSVALCTYNGAAFLPEQLASLAGQTRPPDELVVCDDRSRDDTEAVVRAFAATAPFPVRFAVNERNLGSTRNFERAIGLCTGDLIALCDQDDVWRPEKLARTAAVFEARPAVGLVFTDAEVVSEALRPLGYRLWDSFGFRAAEQRAVRSGRAFELLLKRNVVTGATMAFRAGFRASALPIPPDTDQIHDGWIALAIAAVAEVVALDEPLMLYRQHATQQVGAGSSWLSVSERVQASRATRRDYYHARIAAVDTMRRRLAEQQGRGHDYGPALVKTDAMLDHLRTRAGLASSLPGRVPQVLGELVRRRYHTFSEGWGSAAKDLLLGS